MTRSNVGKVFAAVLLAAALPVAAHAGWGGVRVGIGIGVPIGPYGYGYPYYRPYYPYYYYPPPVVVAPPPVIVQPGGAPPIIAAQPGTQAPGAPPPAIAQTPPPADGTAQAVAASPQLVPVPPPAPSEADLQALVGRLRDGDERVRADAALQLGRMQAVRAIEPLSATLASDRSPAVRDAAARALGLIGTPATLPALQRAAQADDDHEVRSSARFAADAIRDRLHR